MPRRAGSRWMPWLLNSRSAKLNWGSRIRLRVSSPVVADGGSISRCVRGWPSACGNCGATGGPRITDGQNPEAVALAAGADGTAAGMTDGARSRAGSQWWKGEWRRVGRGSCSMFPCRLWCRPVRIREDEEMAGFVGPDIEMRTLQLLV
jgi:hypothetical protein